MAVDWLTYRVHVDSHEPLPGGQVVKFNADGEVEWTTIARMEMAGSFDASVYVRSLSSRVIEISGNPSKFFQGHNLWGSSDVVGTAWALAAEVANRFGLVLIELEDVSRVDLAGLIDVGTPEAVQEIIRALGHAGTMRNRGRGHATNEGTVYWGKHSRRWALKIYDKQREVISTKAVHDVEAVAAVAAGKIRVELVLRSLQLSSMGLKNLKDWDKVDSMKMLVEFLQRVELPEQNQRLDVSALPRHVRAPFFQWAQGDDLRALYPRPTFYRYRRALLAFGVDIAVPPAEPMEIVETKAGVSYAHIPDIRSVGFWEPSEAERNRLGSFEPAAISS